MSNKTLRYATLLALTAALISGTNNFLTKIAVTAVKGPVLYTALKNGVVAIFLIGILIVLKKWPEIKNLTKKQWIKLAAVGVVGGSVPFALYFTGLAQTSAMNASLIHKTLFLWVLMLGIPILKEKLSKLQWLGIITIFGANLFIGGFQGFKYNSGELMILAATILWAVENIIAKSALKDISSLVLASARMVLGSILLFIFVFSKGGVVSLFSLSVVQCGWTLLTSMLLLGYVVTWYTALKHAPATYVATLLVSATLITNMLSAVFVTHVFTVTQVLSSILCLVGLALVTLFAGKAADNVSEAQLDAFKQPR